jgi:ferritin
MACHYNEETGMPPFALFFEEQAEVKREQPKQLLRYLRNREGMICLPVFKRPYTDVWGGAVQTLTFALKTENELTKMLEDLKTSASQTGEIPLLPIVEMILFKQKRNTDYLKSQLSCQKRLEEPMEQESLSEEPAAASSQKS